MNTKKILLLLFIVQQISCFSPTRYLKKQGVSDECQKTILYLKGKIELDESGETHRFNFTSNNLKDKHKEYVEFAQYVSSSKEYDNCFKGMPKETIFSIFGKPPEDSTTIRQYGVRYKFNFGYDCPCADCIESDRLQNCNHLRFFFDKEGNVGRVSMSATDIGW